MSSAVTALKASKNSLLFLGLVSLSSALLKRLFFGFLFLSPSSSSSSEEVCFVNGLGRLLTASLSAEDNSLSLSALDSGFFFLGLSIDVVGVAGELAPPSGVDSSLDLQNLDFGLLYLRLNTDDLPLSLLLSVLVEDGNTKEVSVLLNFQPPCSAASSEVKYS